MPFDTFVFNLLIGGEHNLINKNNCQINYLKLINLNKNYMYEIYTFILKYNIKMI